MPLDQTANFVRGNTDAATDSTQTTISVVDATIFPDPANGEYNLVFWDAENHPRPDQDASVEIVRVTGRDTTNDDLTVTRGQEATTGASHPSGAALQLSPTAKVFGDIAPADQAVEDFTTGSTTSGEVPTSQGDGSLLMESVGGNVPNWQEDGNSPASTNGAGSITYTIADTFDIYYIALDVDDVSGATNRIDLQLDGVTSSTYKYTDYNATQTTSASQIERVLILTANENNRLEGKITGRFGNNATYTNTLNPGANASAQIGKTTDATSPLSQFTFLGESNADWLIEVYGRDIGSAGAT